MAGGRPENHADGWAFAGVFLPRATSPASVALAMREPHAGPENLRLASAGGLVAPPIFVVPADPDLPRLALVAALGCVVEDRVVAHQKLHPAARRGVGAVDGAVVAYERAEPKQLREVANEIGARRAGVVRGDRRQLLGHRLDPLARLPLAARETQVEVEVAARGGDPGNTPPHAALVALQLLQRC